jgi:UDP-glucose 4-epimerase
MRCVVTGGAGFIGSHLVERLVEDGHDVVAVCEGAETLFHLAALADIVPSIERPEEYHGANVDGTFAVLEAVRRAGVRKVVYAASSSCYGIPNVYPTDETTPASPEYPYALTKWVGEQYVLHWGKVYGIEVISLRLFNVYGPRSRTAGTYGAVFGVFLAQKLAGQPLTVVGDGTQVRDFVHVKDVVAAFSAAATSNLDGAVMNVGTGHPQSVNRLVELLQSEVTYLPKRPGEPDVTHADVTRIRELLGWSPTVAFEDGVAEMVERIDDWREAPVWTPASIATATEVWFARLGAQQ